MPKGDIQTPMFSTGDQPAPFPHMLQSQDPKEIITTISICMRQLPTPLSVTGVSTFLMKA